MVCDCRFAVWTGGRGPDLGARSELQAYRKLQELRSSTFGDRRKSDWLIPLQTSLNALSRVWISASLDATVGKHVQSRRASLVLGCPARPSNDLQCFAVRFRCWLSPSFLLSGMLLAIGYATGACCDVAAP